MKYLYKNEFDTIYEADVGKIVKVIDSESIYNNKSAYVEGGTLNGYCYKDYNNFKNNPDRVCYIAECCLDKDTLFVDYVNENKEKLINEGSVSTANSIKEEIRNQLEYEEYYYEYEKDGVVDTIESKDFDDELINQISDEVFENIDWQTSQAYICEVDWRETIQNYYTNQIKNKFQIIKENGDDLENEI